MATGMEEWIIVREEAIKKVEIGIMWCWPTAGKRGDLSRIELSIRCFNIADIFHESA